MLCNQRCYRCSQRKYPKEKRNLIIRTEIPGVSTAKEQANRSVIARHRRSYAHVCVRKPRFVDYHLCYQFSVISLQITRRATSQVIQLSQWESCSDLRRRDARMISSCDCDSRVWLESIRINLERIKCVKYELNLYLSQDGSPLELSNLFFSIFLFLLYLLAYFQTKMSFFDRLSHFFILEGWNKGTNKKKPIKRLRICGI